MYNLDDTIAAIATPPGKGAIGVIRISGSEAIEIADKIFSAKSGRKLSEMKGYSVSLGEIEIEESPVRDTCIALLFRAPKSYTGEDVVEFQCHGGPIVVEALLRGILDIGARMAWAGEFTKRAFLNGRISLTEAEGIADIISAASKSGQRAAYSQSKGSLHRETESIKDTILSCQASIAAWIDFPEEDVEEVEPEELSKKIDNIEKSLKKLISSYEVGLHILRGIPTAIIGSPNVGKSTLMNLISGYEKAIVTPIAGTTRDVLEHSVTLGGTTLVLADTAGIRDSDDFVEREGVNRSIDRIKSSSLILAVFDSSRKLADDDIEIIRKLKDKKAIAVVNKTDLKQKMNFEEYEEFFEETIYITARDRNSLQAIDKAVSKVIGIDNFESDAPIITNERQRSAAVKALNVIDECKKALLNGLTLDVVYVLLDEALSAVMELSGENVSEAVIDRVFEDFCVGK